MFNSKMIGANSAGGGQPAGTGAMVVTCSSSVVGEGGLWISVDDGVTWSQDAFTGIDDPTDNAAWGNWVKWMGSYFALRNNTTKAIYISPDGYNWTASFTPAGDSINAMALDQVTGDAFVSSYVWRGNNYLYRSTDGGATWSLWDTQLLGESYNNFDDMKVYNGKWMASQRFGHAWSNNNGQTWSFRNSLGYNNKFIAQNGRWNNFAIGNAGSDKRGATTGVTSSVGQIESWTIWQHSTYGFTTNIYAAYIASPTGDGQNKILQYARTAFLSPDVVDIAYSLNNGVTWAKWKTVSLDKNQNTLFHNGYFFYRDGYNLIKTNDFSTEIAVSTTPFPFNNIMASMSITW
jgi:hypothetical protein